MLYDRRVHMAFSLPGVFVFLFSDNTSVAIFFFGKLNQPVEPESPCCTVPSDNDTQ